MASKRNPQKKLIRSLDASGFYSDITKEGTLYAALIRSPSASGKIKSITIPDLPEGYFLFTAKDIPGSKKIKINKSNLNIFGFSNIAYTGEPLGILTGPDEETVYELLDKVSVNLDVTNLESALHNVIKNQQDSADSNTKEGTDNLTDFVEQINDLPSLNTVISKTSVEEDPNVTVATREVKYGLYQTLSIEEADKQLFENAKNVSTDTWKQKISTPKWQETEGAFACMEGSNLHVYTPTKWTAITQQALSDVLDLDSENIFIHKTLVSGIYPTGLWKTTQLAVQAALAAYISQKPVRLVLTQKEQDSYMKPGVVTEISYKTAADENGRINAMKVNIDIDVGADNPFAQEITDRIVLATCNYYKPDNLYIFANTHKSKNPPTTVSIKVVDSQAFFAIENEVQKICNQTNNLPDEVRLLNLQAQKAAAKDKEPFPYEISVGNIKEIITDSLKRSDFNRKYASFHMEAIDRIGKDSKPFFALPLRGIGIGTGYVVSGYNGNTIFTYDSKIEVTLTTNDQLVIHCIKPSTVIQEIWKSTASEILQIPKQNVIIDSDFTIDEIPSNPEDTNSSIAIMNELIKKCCNDIQKKRFHQPLPITSKRSASKPSRQKWNKESFSGCPYTTTSSISTVVEVELDTYTYSEKIKGIWISIDCGEIFDTAAAKRTVMLEIQQELGMLVRGKTVTCDSISINFIDSKNKSGQVGGLVHNSLPAAFSSALSLALTTQLTELPCTEDQLFQLIRNRTKANAGEQK